MRRNGNVARPLGRPPTTSHGGSDNGEEPARLHVGRMMRDVTLP